MTLPVAERVRIQARITAVQGRQAIAVASRQSACQSCGGCGAGVLSSYLTRRYQHLIFDNTLGAQAGDQVELSIARATVRHAALLAYGIPLLSLLLGIVLAPWAGAGWVGVESSGGSDALALFGALAGLMSGVWCARRLAARHWPRGLHPVMVAVASATAPRRAPVVDFDGADRHLGRECGRGARASFRQDDA